MAYRQKGETVYPLSEKDPEFSALTSLSGKMWRHHVLLEISCGAGLTLAARWWVWAGVHASFPRHMDSLSFGLSPGVEILHHNVQYVCCDMGVVCYIPFYIKGIFHLVHIADNTWC